MTEDKVNTGLTFRDEVLSKYHKIPFDPDTDNKDLNEELADILVLNPALRDILRKNPDKWGIEDFKKVAEILGQYAFAGWEINDVLEAYAPEGWEALGESLKKEIKEKYFDKKELPADDYFSIDFDIHPFKVSSLGIEKYYKYKRNDGQEIEGWEFITNTPIIINSIGESMDDEAYMYQIRYRTVTSQEFKKWVLPEVLLTSSMKELSNLGIQFVDADQKDLKLYFKQLLGHSYKIPTEFTAKTNGWKKENSIYVTGSFAHLAHGKREILALTEEIAAAYEVKGNKKEWIENLTPLLEYDLIRLKCYATVAAMLIRFIGVRSFVVHNYYESSGLKSVSMQLASSLVGNPVELIKDADSTKVGIEKTLEFNTDTPIYYDETSNNERFREAIYMIGNEQGKGRGTKEGKIEKAARWKTVVQTTGEQPLTKADSTNTGQQIRVLEIFEGIPRLESDYIEKVKETLENNYGLFLDEIVQTIFKRKDKLKLIYKNLNLFFEKSKTVFADRSKTFFIALAVGGCILEEVFEKNGIPTKEPHRICNSYYQKVVIEDPTIPYYMRALDTTYSWHLRNKKLFEYTKELDPEEVFTYTKGPVELLGWISKDAIYYDPDKLQDYLVSKGFNFERVIQDWKNNNILEPSMEKTETGELKYKSWKKYTTINGQRIKGIKVPFAKLQEVLEIRNEEIYDMKDNDKGEIEEIQVSLIEACSRYLAENPKFKNVSYTPEDVADIFIRSKDREELLIFGRDRILEAFRSCKKRK
ncbi:DUF927 domain-containing protein [Methanosarcina sp. 1.H.A.2.2]|uniref:DUF927 domain-containing protein n=1 Tax=Methanosarcina sp. 1.H.A.2.2 TaxID=1483601 RepID=UPI0006221324|nr:DUF927 domain-containing protein [Methanosarcina sp. 1.H.A.2.2]KKH49782.1 hypothetical protein EO93_01855 [Methanosarcina sp. 1.H.A.2.2]